MSEATDVLESLPCSLCGAETGEPCRTKGGRKTLPHADRWYLARDRKLLPWQRTA